MGYRIGIDLGGTKVALGLLDDMKSIVAKHTACLPVDFDYETILQFIQKTLNAFLEDNNISFSEIQSCGVGVPGTVSADGNKVLKAPNLHWDNMYVAEDIKRLIRIPVSLVQDSRAAAWGEYLVGAGQGKSTVVCVTLGTGIGTGIVMDGKIFNGALGSAGELGHVPVSENGRLCGCGRRGCLENYAAGKGIAITANERMPEKGGMLSAMDVFCMAGDGNKMAKSILDEAVCILGKGIVSLFNLLSPDALLFSGGMSRQKELFTEPLMQFIRSHIYTNLCDDSLHIGYASLGVDAPWIGAALIPQVHKKAVMSASLMCADMMNMETDLRKLEAAEVEYLHFDIMDGHFVPNLMLPLELINAVRSKTCLPFDIHLMAEKPEAIIPKLNLVPNDLVSVHWESTSHIQRVLSMIKDEGARAVLALNPSTPIECCRELLEDVSMILLMTVNPGYAGQKLIPQSLDKIKRLRQYLDGMGFQNIRIEVDGNCSYENTVKMYQAGADTFVVGSSSIFDPALGIVEGAKYLRELLKII